MARILVAEDSSSMRQMITFTLKAAGFEIDEATDGNEALNKAKSQHFDAIITDVNMPNKDGFELTSELRKITTYKAVPILLLTTESAQSKKEQGRAAGATGWIIKPFNPETLVYTVNKVLN